MIDRNADFRLLIHRLKIGDTSAADELVNVYGPHVSRAIRRRFRRQKMRVLYNTDDCLQSVWGSVFADPDRLDRIESPQHLTKYLAKIAANKLIDEDRRLRAQKNDIYRECALPGSDTADRFGLANDDPTPSQQVANEDEFQERTKELPTRQRTVLELNRQGYTSEEIAEQTEYSGRGIRRIIEKFGKIFGK